MSNKKQSLNEVKYGAVISYLLVILNTVYGLVLTPYILFALGDLEYGVYKTITALSSSVMVLDLGLGGTVTRYIAFYLSRKEKDKIKPFVSMASGEALILVALVTCACLGILFGIPMIYKNGLNASQIGLAKKLFWVLTINMAFHIIENLLNGLIAGYNKYIFANGAKLIRVLIRIVLTYVLLIFFHSSLILVSIDLLLTILLIIAEGIYILFRIKAPLTISFKGWDKSLFWETSKYTGFLFLTSIAAQVNSNLDNVVVGAELGAASVTVYSMGLAIFAMFENISISVSGVMLPTVTNAIVSDPSGEKVKDIVVKAGRIQFMLLGAVLAGFLVLGKDFINLWLGKGFSDVYVIVLILIIPTIFELCVNVCLSILRAKNMLGFRTLIISLTTIANAIITIVGVKLFGYYAAAVGTAFSSFVGSVIIMNIYYYKKLNIDMMGVHKKIFSGTWICLGISICLTLPVSRYLRGSWLAFAVDVMVFGISYFVFMLVFGFSKTEKAELPIINKLKRR